MGVPSQSLMAGTRQSNFRGANWKEFRAEKTPLRQVDSWLAYERVANCKNFIYSVFDIEKKISFDLQLSSVQL